MMILIKDGGFQVEAECYNVVGKYFDPIEALEKEQHLVGD